MRPIDRQALIDVIADAKRTDPETGSFVGWLADCLVEYLKQPNEPLTLDELRKMDGKPVYLVVDDGFEPLKMWALVDYIKEEQCLTLTNNLGGRSQYYTADDLEIDHITAYRRPPEGGAT